MAEAVGFEPTCPCGQFMQSCHMISSQPRYDHFDTAATGCGRVASQSHNHRID